MPITDSLATMRTAPKNIEYATHMGNLSMAIFALLLVAFFIFHIAKWQFVKGALSETKDGVSSPSGFRLMGYWIVISCCIAFLYMAFRKQELVDSQLNAMLIAVGVLLGFIKVVDLFSIWKGGKVPETPPQPTPITTTTTTTETETK